MVQTTYPDKGWAWMVLFASFGAHVIHSCFFYSIGIIHTAILNEYEESISYTSWAGTLMLALLSFTGPVSSFMVTRFNCRVTTIVGGILLAVGCFVSGFVSSLHWVIIMFGIVGGIGCGLTYSASVIVVGFNFERKRTLAGCIAVSGVGVGTFLFPLILTYADQKYGYTGIFVILAGISLQHCLWGTIFRPSVLENESKRSVNNDSERKKHIFASLLPYRFLLRKKSIILMCLSFICWNLGVFMSFLHLPYYVITKGTSPMDASFLISIAGVCGLFSRIITGFVGSLRKVKEIYLYIGSFCLLGVSTCLFPLYSFSYSGQIFYSAILGMFCGNCYGIMNSINVCLVGIEHMATAFGLEIFSSGIGVLIGPTLAGFIVDSGGSYEQSFIMAGSTICMGGLLGLVIVCSCGVNTFELNKREGQKVCKDVANEVAQRDSGIIESKFRTIKGNSKETTLSRKYTSQTYSVPVNPVIGSSFARGEIQFSGSFSSHL